MKLKNAFCAIILAVFVFAIIDVTNCKRGGGRRGGTYRGSSSVWGRNKQSQSGYDSYGRRAKQSPDAPQPELYKPSAPPAATNGKAASADFIHHEKNPAQAPSTKQRNPSSDLIQQEKSPSLNANNKKPSSSADFLQHEKNHQAGSQSSGVGAQKPIGWDVGQNKKVESDVNKNVGWNVGNSNYNHNSGTMGHQQAPPPYTAHAGSYPNTGASSYYGTGNNYNYGSAHHPQQSLNQPLQGHYPNSNMGGVPQQNLNNGPYYNNMNGYHNAPMGGNHYGNPGGGYGGGYGGGGYGGGYGGGGYGGGFGGSGYGNSFGGFGGGHGGFGMGGYGKSYGGGFGSGFGKNAVRNVLVGVLVWNLVSGLTRRPYHVYNYYNNPEKVPQEIPLPANMIVLCSDNVNSLCAPNTAPLCTNDNKILCVVLAQATGPCGDNSAQKCVNSTVTCTQDSDNPCGDDVKEKTSTISIPCVTNATIIGKILDNTTISFSGTGNIMSNDGTTSLCVTTLALPEPETDVNQNSTLCVDKNAEGQNGTTPCLNNSSSVSPGGPITITPPTPVTNDSLKKPEGQ